MSQLFKLILSVMVLTHTTFGCCAHHVHSAQTNCHQPRGDCRAAFGISTSHHAHQHHEFATPADECPLSQEEGCGGEMHILDRTEVLPSEPVVLSCRFVDCVAAETIFQRGQTILPSRSIPAPDGKGPPASTHGYLFLGVLLL